MSNENRKTFGSWVPIKVQRKASGFRKYQTRDVVIISGERHPKLYITKAVWEKLGMPEKVVFFKRGQNVAFCNYAVIGNPQDHTPMRVLLPHSIDYYVFVNFSGFIKQNPIGLGVYDVHYEEGGVLAVFDSLSKASLP